MQYVRVRVVTRKRREIMYTDINIRDINLFRGIYNLFRKFIRMFILFLIEQRIKSRLERILDE